MAKNIIFNKTLGITEFDVKKEQDLLKLREWRNVISEQVSSMKLTLDKMDIFKEDTGSFQNEERYINIASAKQKQNILLKYVDNQIAFFKAYEKREKTIAQHYMEISREHIDEDLYALLVKKAQVRSMR